MNMFAPFAGAVALSLTATIDAQPLAEHVPEDALVYVAWRGVESMQGYEGSHLRGVAEAANVVGLLRETLPAMIETQAARGGNPGGAMISRFLREMGPVLWTRPCAVYAAGFTPGDAGEPQPNFGLLLEPGAHREAVRAWMQRIVEQTQDQPGPTLRLIDEGDVLGLRVGTADGAIGDSDSFAEATGALGVEPGFIAYIDLAGIYDEIDLMLNDRAGDAQLDAWQVWTDTLGLNDLRQFVVAGGLAGADWRTEFHLRADDPSGTILHVLAGAPLGETELRLVPRSATWLLAQRLDLAAVLAEVRKVWALMPAGGQPGLDAVLAQARQQLGIDLENDLVKPLGDAWLVYSEPAVAGPLGVGVVAINPLRDAAKVEAALTTLEGKFNELSEAKGQPERFTTLDLNGMTVHTLATPVASPSWAVKDGRLYVGLFPQALMTADLYTKQANASILESAKFQAVMQRLGDRPYNAVMYADLPQTAPPVYGLYQTALQMVGVGALRLPPMAALQAHLAPAGQVTWSDAAGLHSHAISPFPGSTLLSQQALVSAPGMTWPMLMGAGAPAVGAAGETGVAPPAPAP